jgi:hypothetical protein
MGPVLPRKSRTIALSEKGGEGSRKQVRSLKLEVGSKREKWEVRSKLEVRKLGSEEVRK